MKNNSTVPLSEGHKVITRALNTPGECIHFQEGSGYLTLYSKRTSEDGQFVLVDNDAGRVGNVIRVQIGWELKTFMCNTQDEVLLKNVHVQDEEIWAATNAPNQYIVYGFVSQHPLP